MWPGRIRIRRVADVFPPNRRNTIHFNFIAISDAEILKAVEPIFQHVITNYASIFDSLPKNGQ
jgi:hypothetical protein